MPLIPFRFHWILIAFLLWSAPSLSQDDLRQCNKVPFKVFVTQETATLENLLKQGATFESVSKLENETRPSNHYWIQIDFLDELERIQKDSIYHLRLRTFEYGDLFFEEQGDIESRPIGVFEISNNKNLRSFPKGFAFTKDNLIENRYLYARVQRVTYFDKLSRWEFYYCSDLKNTLLEDYFSQEDVQRLAPIYIFVGICLVMFILTLGFYLYSRRKEFLFYALYVLFLFLYLCSDVLKLYELFFGGFGKNSYTFFQVSQVMINLFYILFVIQYLGSKQNYPKLHIALKVIAIMLATIVFSDFILLFSSQFLIHIYVLDTERLIMSVFGLVAMIYLLIKTKDKLGYFVVSGSFFYMIGALGFLFLKQRYYMITGATLEILIFASGLTYKIQQENKEKLVFQRISLENEIKALQAQMNPHFIFNSLSSIQNLITSGKKESAVKYLNTFSTLMRNLLENTFHTQVVLKEEISLLKKYLELESLRFNESFKYSIAVAPEVDVDAIEIPALLIQPFVENAIIHGLLPKKEQNKQLEIRFQKEQDTLICVVEDNGIGREAAKKIKEQKTKNPKSRGIEMTKKRVELFNHSNENHIFYTDKLDQNGKPLGTLVKIELIIE